MSRIEHAEMYVTKRYERWRNQTIDFDYKQKKAARIASIITETGGLEPLAVELGVGPGGIAAELGRRGMTIVGIDLSPDALYRAKEHCRSHPVRLLQASGFSLPLASQSIPLVYASQVLHLFDHPERLALMKEACRVLAPGGRFIFDMKNIWSHPLRYLSSQGRRARNFPTKSALFGLLDHAGFSTVSTRPGVFPIVNWPAVPNVGVYRLLSHTTFYIATK